jgi:hypothetical protein
MSKRINVNPDHYKLAGRERPGDAQAAKSRAARSAANHKIQNRWLKRKGSAR